jgi:glycosyltransferase involved in cell wall biosynthesis
MARTQHASPTREHQVHDQPRVSIVVPVYNEVATLPELTTEILTAMGEVADQFHPYEIIFVEDESDDGTAALVDDLADDMAAVRAIHLKKQGGQSAALAAGFDHARGEVIVPMDGDGQNDPADIPRLLDELERGDWDCVSGNRNPRDDPLAKRIPSKVQTKLTDAMCADVRDYGCTLKAYRADALAEIDLRGEHHRYIPAQLHARGHRLTEIDVNHRPRDHGESSYGSGRLLRGFFDAIYYLLITRYGARPMHIFGGVGLLLGGLGGLLGGHMLVERLILGNPISQHMPRLVLISLLVIVGLFFVGLGFLSELLTRVLYRDERPYRVQEVVE